MLLVAIQMYAFQKSKVRARIAEHSRGDQVKKLEILVRGSKSLAGHGAPLPSAPDALLLFLTSLANGLCISWMVDQESIDVDKVREALHFTFDKLTGFSGKK